ncbi:MAG: glucose 1-dehydrogenase [Verrucomicrobia bacterium]|nr:glucose 1-dehydrogenase [Verrucomicrobiota bacterium]
MGNRLNNKTCIITGGTTGLGFEMAKRYIEEGSRVMITGRSQKKIDEAVKELGKSAAGVAADSTKIADLVQLADKAKEMFGRIDILIANAGGGVFAPIEKVDEDAYNTQFNVNVKGVFFTVQKMLPLMKKGGSIILTSSAVNSKGASTGSIYYASKAAVRSFVRSMAAELGPQGIRVNSLSPGIIPTQFFNNSNLGEAGYGQFEKFIVAQTPLGRSGTPLDIANAAVFLGSDESSYVNAADLVVDGGWSNI